MAPYGQTDTNFGCVDSLRLRETLQRAARHAEIAAEEEALEPVFLLAGRAHLGLGDPARAWTFFDRHIRLFGPSAGALLWRAQASFERGTCAAVRTDCTAALRTGRVPRRLMPVALFWAAEPKREG